MAEFEREHGGLFRAMRAIKRQRTRAAGARTAEARPASPMGPSGVLHSLTNGMQTLTDAMADNIGSRLHTALPLRGIQKRGDGWHLQFDQGTVQTQSLVLACPAWISAPLLHDTDAAMALELAAIHSAPVAVVCMGFTETDVEPVARGFGFLVPGREHTPVLGTLFDTWIFPNRSHVGTVLFRTLLGGARHPEAVRADDSELLSASLETLRKLLGLVAQPMMTQVIRHTRGIPQYNIGHEERLQRLETLRAQHAGLWLTGNSYRGVAMNACIREAEDLAQTLCKPSTTRSDTL
jgi:oxygen-dependent protoporphyrinogen oxidase